MNKQSTSHLFMIEPESFYSNEQTSYTNHYQKEVIDETPEDVAGKALAEFHNLKNKIEEKGIKVTSLKGSKDCPDHIFPNWFITFQNKTMQIFSMLAPNRRKEKKLSMIEHLTKTYELTDDMSYLEEKEIFLESTSSMVFDRVNRIVYAGISPRTNAVQLIIWCRNNDFELVLFETESHTGSPIYHTDVLMYVGTDIIGICFDVIKEEHRDYVKKKVAEFHDVVELTAEQIENFCGNAIEAKNNNNDLFLILSSTAYNALNQSQIDKLLESYKDIIHSDIPTIEKYGGGSARCMLTELF
ncbi:arginine deiminase-related protein [Gammaproteobacteria bacterium]|nr:arginine deiminase-related protein [Gammaproteobacteria bacterium]|tara:strand:+ start:195 stop:1091 length:897 start_codon:yes stop_codon:yes gene_type:complete